MTEPQSQPDYVKPDYFYIIDIPRTPRADEPSPAACQEEAADDATSYDFSS